MVEIPAAVVVFVVLLVGFLSGVITRRPESDLAKLYYSALRSAERAETRARNLDAELQKALTLYRGEKKRSAELLGNLRKWRRNTRDIDDIFNPSADRLTRLASIGDLLRRAGMEVVSVSPPPGEQAKEVSFDFVDSSQVSRFTASPCLRCGNLTTDGVCDRCLWGTK